MGTQTQTAVSLTPDELQAVLELCRLAEPRMTTAEKLYYNALLTRFANELEAQERASENP